MTIIFRYLNKEILGTLFAVTFVLLLIFLSNQLVRNLSYAAAGKLATNILMQLMGFEIPVLLALLLPLGLYLGIILAYGKLYADNELRVLQACGLSLGQLILLTSTLIAVITLTVCALTLWVNPWIFSQKERLITQSLSADNLLDTLMPGRFQVSTDGRRVLYVERITRSRAEAGNLFIADQGGHPDESNLRAWTIVSAVSGGQETLSDDRFLVAKNGYRYEGTPGQNDFKITQFKKYAIRLPQTILTSKRQEQESIPSRSLWKNYQKPESAAELQWRLSIPLATLLLGILAIPLSQVEPRRGRYSQLFPAILVYIIYINALFVVRNWVEQKFIPIGIGIWWVHLVALGGVVLFFIYQAGWDIKQWMRRSA